MAHQRTWLAANIDEYFLVSLECKTNCFQCCDQFWGFSRVWYCSTVRQRLEGLFEKRHSFPQKTCHFTTLDNWNSTLTFAWVADYIPWDQRPDYANLWRIMHYEWILRKTPSGPKTKTQLTSQWSHIGRKQLCWWEISVIRTQVVDIAVIHIVFSSI